MNLKLDETFCNRCLRTVTGERDPVLTIFSPPHDCVPWFTIHGSGDVELLGVRFTREQAVRVLEILRDEAALKCPT